MTMVIRSEPGARSGTVSTTLDAVFQAPEHGPDLPVRIRLFQFDEDGRVGMGFYFVDDNGAHVRGTVLRWDHGAHTDPTVVQWQAPHCKNDDCGSPCEHRREAAV